MASMCLPFYFGKQEEKDSFDPNDKDVDNAQPIPSFEKAATSTYKVVVLNPSSNIPVGKDLPRLMCKISVQGGRISPDLETVRDRLKALLTLLYIKLVPEQNSQSKTLQSIQEVFDGAKDEELINHDWLQTAIIQLFTDEHPVFQILRVCNQSAISQAVIFLKNMLQNKAKKEYKDKDWYIDIEVKLEDEANDWTKQTVIVTHNRSEKVMKREKNYHLSEWFLFRWSCIFTFERKFNKYSADMAPLDFVALNLSYNGSHDYNTSLLIDKEERERFGSTEKINAFIGGLFQKFAKEYKYEGRDDVYFNEK
jgi:hypothetical protein